MSLFRTNYDPAPAGERVVRVLALAIATLAIIGALRGHGGAAYLSWLTAGLFLLAAAAPRAFGRIAGTVIVILSALALFMGPHGEPMITANGLLFSVPPMLVGGLLINPSIVDTIMALLRPSE